MSVSTSFCDVCCRTFKNSTGLKIHKSRIHKLDHSQFFGDSEGVDVTLSRDGNKSVPLHITLALQKRNHLIIKRIPKATRMLAAATLTKLIDQCIRNNSAASWENLLMFPYKSFSVPYNKSDHKESLTSVIRRNLNNPIQTPQTFTQKKKHFTKSETFQNKLVLSKVSDGDLSSAVKILCSDDSVAEFNEATLLELQSKHPKAVHQSIYPMEYQPSSYLKVTKEDVHQALKSFRTSSAGGLDSLRPSHMQDMISYSTGAAGDNLLSSLTTLCNLLLSGGVPEDICPIIYGASLCGLKKKSGGIRPIAVGSFYRRLVAKIACFKLRDKLGEYFRPIQFGFGTAGGCEAVVHAARRYINHHNNSFGKVFLKLDFKNAFNMIHRHCMLQIVSDAIPELYSFISQCYRHPSFLTFGENVLMSERGVQQGDPLAPALFCLTIHNILKNINTEFNGWYLDDGSFGGDAYIVLDALSTIIAKSKEVGLELNYKKCELFFLDESNSDFMKKLNTVAPGIKTINKSELLLLGTPLTDNALPFCLQEKINSFRLMSSRLTKLPAHVAFHLLKHCLAIPKMIYILRCCPSWHDQCSLETFDNSMRETLQLIVNNPMDDKSWLQASLPVTYGGLGIRLTSSLALPAFLSSLCSLSHVIDCILPIGFPPDLSFKEGERIWTDKCNSVLPINERIFQKAWDLPLIKIVTDRLLSDASNSSEKARLNAVFSKDAGAWLNALPVSCLGTLLDNESFRIAVGFRLGSVVCVQHKCVCGTLVDDSGTHGLCCKLSAGRFSRHQAVNDLIRRALVSAKVPAVLEPLGTSRDDGKRPDGMTIIPWQHGKPVVWDFTCVDTLAPSHISTTSVNAGSAAAAGEKLKTRKYENLKKDYIFYPIGIETFGVFGPQARKFIKEIGRRITKETNEPRATTFLIQQISMAIQRGNAASFLGTIPWSKDFEELFMKPNHEFKNSSSMGFPKPLNVSIFSSNPKHSTELLNSSTSPKFTSPTITPSNPISCSLNSSTVSRRSTYRDNHHIRDYSEEDFSGERCFNIMRPVVHSTVKTFGLNGLRNIGNSCFMNSVIQCLSNTRWLLEYLKRDSYTRDINTSISSMKGALIKEFAKVIKELWSEDSLDRVVNIASLRSQIQKFAPRFIGYAQQDAQEFLRYLLDGLHEDVNRITEKPNIFMTEIDENLSDSEKAQEAWSRYSRKDNSKIVDNFVGQLKSTVKCTYCGHYSVTFDPFWDLSLPIPHKTGQLGLSHCLDSFTSEETLDGDEKPRCSKCKKRRKCTKSLSIHKFPKVLVIHLKRFSPTENFQGKLDVTVDFPLVGLDLSNYAANNIHPCRYSLYALSNHSGTTRSGHYTAYCRHPYVGSWHEFNDSKVSSISSESIVSGDAVVLFYEEEDTEYI